VSPRLELGGVTARRAGQAVLDGVSLSVGPGEVVGVVGPNGAGKTTLFNLITGVLKPDGGRVLFEFTERWRLTSAEPGR